jgi:WD40 repeat protein
VTRRLVAELSSSATVTAAAFSPDGSILAVGSADGVRLWNVATPGHVKQITEVPLGGRGAGSALTFSPDGRILAVGDSVGTAQLWDAATGRQIGLSLVAGNAPVTSVAFTRDGATLATANADGIARLWSTTTGNPIGGELPGGSKIYSVAFSPDGQTLATTGANGSASLWRLKYPGGSGSLLARVCAIADGSLTRSEWTQYVQGGIPFQHVCP